MQAPEQPKRRGRPPLQPGEGLTGRIPDRFPQDVADKARLLGRDRLIEMIRREPLPPVR